MNTATRPQTIAFTVPGRPVGKERARVANGRAYTPERTRAWEEAISWQAQLTLRDKPMLVGDVSLTLKIYVSGGVYPDVDNVLKCVKDGMQRIIYANDKQVSEVYAVRYPCKRGDERIEVVVQERVQ